MQRSEKKFPTLNFFLHAYIFDSLKRQPARTHVGCDEHGSLLALKSSQSEATHTQDRRL